MPLVSLMPGKPRSPADTPEDVTTNPHLVQPVTSRKLTRGTCSSVTTFKTASLFQVGSSL